MASLLLGETYFCNVQLLREGIYYAAVEYYGLGKLVVCVTNTLRFVRSNLTTTSRTVCLRTSATL